MGKISPLESFLQKYVEAVGGMWEEVEPQVYDVLLPLDVSGEEEILRLTFDPEALPEHPNAQLITYGAPLLERFFEDAQKRWSFARAYLLIGFHLPERELQARIRRELRVPEDISIDLKETRPLYFANALFWFRATFISDEKEQELFFTAVDLYYGRQVRHLGDILSSDSLSERRPMPYPDAPRIPIPKAYRIARQRVIRTVGAMANTRKQEMEKRIAKQIERMTRYFHDLREELRERISKAEEKGSDTKRLYERLNAIDREEQVRIAELKGKTAMRVQLQLLNLMMLMQPKLMVQAELIPEKGPSGFVPLVWDPLTERLEAPQCPTCSRPSFSLKLDRHGRVICPECSDG
jgi:hypothetical protein